MISPSPKEHAAESERQHWLRRSEATGQAQRRYLWLLFVLGLFYGALRSQPVSAEQITVPAVGLTLNAATVIASGGPILSFLVLAVMGSIRAWTHALAQYRGKVPDEDAEQLDTHPNALDLAMYTTVQSPRMVKRLLYFIYPVFLTAFLVESFWLEWWAWSNNTNMARAVSVGFWLVLWAPAAWLVLTQWWKRARNVSSIGQ